VKKPAANFPPVGGKRLVRRVFSDLLMMIERSIESLTHVNRLKIWITALTISVTLIAALQ
jgi:hypothetical protein